MSEPRIKQSACWGCFCREGVTPEQFVRTAAQIGYRSIEMGPQEHWDLIKEHGLDIAIFVGHKSLTDGLNDPANHDRIEDELNASLDLAVQYGVPTLLCLSGNRRGMSDEAGLENCATCLNRVVSNAEAKGVTLAVELLNSKVNHPDYMCDRTAWGVEVCKAVGSPRVKLLYDIYHMQIMEGDVIATLRESMEYIGHIHTGGVPGRNEIDATQELNYPAIMRAVVELGYTGYVAHEFVPKGDPLTSLAAAAELCDV